MERTRARRYVTLQRDRSLLRLWGGVPAALDYMLAVIRGTSAFDQGRYKCCVAILSRCLPTVTSQEVRSDATSITARVEVPASAQEELHARLGRIERLAALVADENGNNGTQR